MEEVKAGINVDTRENLEVEKLKIDVANLKRPWFQRPEYLSALLPSTIALGTLMVLWLNGNFNSKAELLQIRKEKLELQIKEEQNLLDSFSKITLKNSALANELKQKNILYIQIRDSLIMKSEKLEGILKRNLRQDDSIQLLIDQNLKEYYRITGNKSPKKGK